MPERLILCGGARRAGEDTILRLALSGRSQNITLRLEDISRKLVSNVPGLLIDLIEIASYVYCADQAISRGGDVQRAMGADWRRNFRFVIPVRNPDHWNNPTVLEPLCATLSFLSEDEYAFEFERAANPVPLQNYLEFGDDSGTAFNADEVVLFSGGLDSLGGAIDELSTTAKRVALVSHHSSTKVYDFQKQLISELKTRFPQRLIHLPVLMTRQQDALPAPEYTHRSRSFLYASLACAVARLFGKDEIRFFENGVLSINLPISEQVVGARATRTTHPLALERLREFFSAVTGRPIQVVNPFIWKTKADVIRSIVNHGCGPLIKHTVSCTRTYDITKLHTHCGCCSQCLDRRFAVLAAGAGEHDSIDMYKVELLAGKRDKDEDKTMAESYVRTALELRDMGEHAFFGRFGGETARVLTCFPSLSADDVGRRVFDLHQRHARAIGDVLKAAVETHSAELVKGGLPSSSVIMMTVARGGTPEVARIGKRADPLKAWLEEEEESASADRGGGRYVPDWERLLDALKRVIATGMREADAKLDLCHAISDRKIDIRFLVEREEGEIGSVGEAVAGTVRHGSEVDIPTDLKPSDFDWQRSRPLKPWRALRAPDLAQASQIGGQYADLLHRMRIGSGVGPPLWHLDWIEVSRKDVAAVLCGDEDGERNAARKLPATVRHETNAIRALASHLRANKQMTRAAAAEWCRQSGYNLGKRAFERVWPQARESAGLGRIGTPGRKRKLTR